MATALGAFPQIGFVGNVNPPVTEIPAPSTGLEAVYVLDGMEGVSVSYQAASTGPVKWYRFSNLGGGFAEELTNIVRSGDTYTLNNPSGDMGYIIDDGSSRHCFWIVDYTLHRLELKSLSFGEESNCATVQLSVAGNADPIRYYTVNGQAVELSRGLTLRYSTLSYNEESDIYTFDDRNETIAHVTSSIMVNAPLCNTDFTLSGDRFLEAWGYNESVTSPYYEAVAVEAHTSAEQVERDNDNEQKGDISSLGGSAPAEIEFRAAVSDAVIFKEWQIATDSEFDLIDYRSNDLYFNYVFRKEGAFYVRFVAGNASGTCEFVSPAYEVSIGDSDIRCPNAFSPGSSEGVNDVWKVSYKSLIDFECHIFNRWGIQVCHFTDPSQGWDGKYNGKLVPSGVYYYVIKATGADGKEYKLKGDINIINYKPSTTGIGGITE